MKTSFSPSPRSRSAFTLIELLVVIAIIAILAAILFPVFGRARENARRTSCLSNLKQVGLSFAQYNQDYDEFMPMGRAYGTYNTSWDAQLEPYMVKAGSTSYGTGKNPLLVCPSDSIVRTGTPARAPRSYAVPFNYANNAFTYKEEIPYPGGAYIPGRNISEFPAVSTTLMLAELPNDQNAIGTNAATVARPIGRNIGEYASSQDGGFQTSARGLAGKQLHFDGWNYLFVDGHAKWLKPEATIGTGVTGSPRGMWTITEND